MPPGLEFQQQCPIAENLVLLKAGIARAAVHRFMEDRRQLLEKLERYRTILRLTADPQAIAALEQLIRETRHRLDELDPVDHRIGDRDC